MKKKQTMTSGLQGMVENLMRASPQINQVDTLTANLRRYPITIDRPTLNFLYIENGIIRTAIDQPIDDALRGGVDWESDELSADDIKRLDEYFEDKDIWGLIKAAMAWGRVFGGGGLVINNGQDASTKLDLKSMNEKSPLQFYDADRWELQMPEDSKKPDPMNAHIGDKFYYWGKPLHRSRVMTVVGEKAPSLTRHVLMGWGLSEVEKMVRDLNEYLKAQNLIFELLDEAKIDVYRLAGYKAALSRPGGQAKMEKAIGLTNSMKSFMSALMLDKDDEYEQKQLTFSGLAEMLKEIRIGIASTLRMPVTKLFGMSAAGFNSGEDDIENYNAMIESTIRARLRPLIKKTADLICIKLFGYSPQLGFKYKSLRILNANEEADLKTKEQQMVLNNYERGLYTAEECMKAQRVKGLLTGDKSAAEEGMTDDFPVPPIDTVRQTIKEEDGTDKKLERDNPDTAGD